MRSEKDFKKVTYRRVSKCTGGLDGKTKECVNYKQPRKGSPFGCKHQGCSGGGTITCSLGEPQFGEIREVPAPAPALKRWTAEDGIPPEGLYLPVYIPGAAVVEIVNGNMIHWTYGEHAGFTVEPAASVWETWNQLYQLPPPCDYNPVVVRQGEDLSAKVEKCEVPLIRNPKEIYRNHRYCPRFKPESSFYDAPCAWYLGGDCLRAEMRADTEEEEY